MVRAPSKARLQFGRLNFEQQGTVENFISKSEDLVGNSGRKMNL